ncbi:MAG: asparagine synthase (glutamine-hydrolyzing) [Myxococcota bacterium]|nr:asparagine synthase (glutamine-hydrolyzing) [Myxococcota bacterium]
MCGIAGVINFSAKPPNLARLEAMGQAMLHRGPDGGGTEIKDSCGLVHRRLAILDLSDAGKQPMSTVDGRFWISHNGEVYNYIELRKELEAKGHQFRSGTDTEVILSAYREWGCEAFSRFNGMWGLAIYDVKRRVLVLSRDRMGIKPLFVHSNKERLLFGSEIKALLSYDPSIAKLNYDAAGRFLEHSFLPYEPDTFFEGIVSVPAGTTLEITQDAQQTSESFWTFTPLESPRSLSMRDAAEEFRDLLTDSLKLRFRADVPVGTCLSGGLDSSSLVALSSKELGLHPEAFSAVYTEEKYNEAEFVRIMVNEFGLKGHEVSPGGTNLNEIAHDIIYHQESPVYGPGLFSQWQVMKLATPHVTVLLDGQGGDELFGGYFYYFPFLAQILFDRAKRGDVTALHELLSNAKEVKEMTGHDYYAGIFRNKPKRWLKQQLVRNKNRALRGLHRTTESLPAARELLKALNLGGGLAEASGNRGPKIVHKQLWDVMKYQDQSYKTPAVVTGNPLTDKLWADVTQQSIPSLLRYEDRNSMAYSLEARVPLLDHRIVEFAFSIPNELKIDGTWTKQVIREATRGILPETIRARKNKMGYPTPFASWLRMPENVTWLRDVLASKQFNDRKFVSRHFVENLIDEHVHQKRDHSWQLCRMISFEVFCQKFLDTPFEAHPEIRRPNRPVA